MNPRHPRVNVPIVEPTGIAIPNRSIDMALVGPSTLNCGGGGGGGSAFCRERCAASAAPVSVNASRAEITTDAWRFMTSLPVTQVQAARQSSRERLKSQAQQ